MTAVQDLSPYLLAEPDRRARLRLFCFHHAGGGAAAFADWREPLGPDVAVVPVQLPGRENRVREPRLRTMEAVLAELDEHVSPWLDLPHAYYGHSMGAFVAHALTCRRREQGASLPERLVIGAARAPHLPLTLGETVALPDPELGRVLVSIGGMSEILLDYPDWLAAATGMLRDDLAVCASNPYVDAPPIPVRLRLLAGVDDPLARPEQIEAWSRYGAVGSALRVLPGGHFFHRDHAAEFLSALSAALR